jgi:hypothetical protein
MQISRFTIKPGASVLIVEDFFTQDLLEEIHQYFDTWQDRPDEWIAPTELHQGVRWQCIGKNPLYTRIRDYFGSEEIIKQFNLYVPGKKLHLSNFAIWMDQRGFGPMEPHVENDNGWLAQIFVTRVEHPYTGTTIYSDPTKILVQLPYRNNFGWFFDRGGTVLHGRAHDVPEGIDRFIIMAWYGDGNKDFHK